MQQRDQWSHISTGDLALVQEAIRPLADGPLEILPAAEDPWLTSGWEARKWRTAIARLTDAVEIRPHLTTGAHDSAQGALEVSRTPSTCAALERAAWHG